MPAECTLVFPKLKGRVSDSGSRSRVTEKAAVKALPSPRLLSNLGVAHTGASLETTPRCCETCAQPFCITGTASVSSN